MPDTYRRNENVKETSIKRNMNYFIIGTQEPQFFLVVFAAIVLVILQRIK